MFDYKTAIEKLKLGKRVSRKDWVNGVLCLCKNYVQVMTPVEGCCVQILDESRWAFWDLNREDIEATDWYES